MKKYRLSLTKKLETGMTLEVFAATPAEAAEIANRAVLKGGREVHAMKIDLSEDYPANLLVNIDTNFTEALISEVEPSGKGELADTYRFLLMKGYDYMGDDRLLKYESEAVFVKPLWDANGYGLNADLHVKAKLNHQTGSFDYFIESHCYQSGKENKNVAVPAMLHLRDKMDGMTIVELKDLLPHYEQKCRRIITLVLAGAGENYPPLEKPTKYGEIRKALKIMALQKAELN